MAITETKDIALCRLGVDDAPFILELLNDPGWLRFIGDKGVNSIGDARNYILDGPVKSYEQFGFGLFLARLKQGEIPIGICGLLKRDYLDHPDLGFAFLPEFRGKGYACQAAAAAIGYGKDSFGFRRILAITLPGNLRSINLLRKCGFTFEKRVNPSGENSDLQLFRLDL